MQLDNFDEGIGRIAFTSDGASLLVADCGRSWGLRELPSVADADGTPITVLAVAGPPVPEGEDENDGSFYEWPRGICHDADGGLFLAASGESLHTALHLSLPSATLLGHAGLETSYPMALALSPDGQTLAMMDFQSGPEAQHAVVLVQANAIENEDKEPLVCGRGSAGVRFQEPNDVAFSLDGRHLLVADRGVIWILDAASGSLVQRIEVEGDAQGLAVDSQGQIIVVTDTRVQLFAPVPGCDLVDPYVGGLDLDKRGGKSVAVRADGLIAVATGRWYDYDTGESGKPNVYAVRVR